jgi:hypothetical protein
MGSAVARAMNEALVVRGALAGLTPERIDVINDAIVGCPVRIESDHVLNRPTIGVFLGIKHGSFLGGGGHELVVGGNFAYDGRDGFHGGLDKLLTTPVLRVGGISRHVGVGVLRSLDVLGPGRTRCSECGGWALPGALFDMGPGYWDPTMDEDERGPASRLACKRMDEWGECR